jgi:DNA replicative helicase MCM subunit Mcm2 (Cdc46/Mcm family)
MFEDFLKSVTDRSGGYVYRTKISQLISDEGKSVVVDFGDLLKYNNDLGNRILVEPDSALSSFRIAVFETMRSENALYADRVKRELAVRIRGIPDLVPLRKVDTSYLDRMLAVSGMVVRTSELRPLMTSAAWVCPSGHLTYQDQDELALKRPPRCELCGEIRNFELDKKHSRFIDFQVLRIQELPEELPPGQLPQFFDVNVEGDIVNTARPGDRVVLTGIVRASPDYGPGAVKTRLFRSQIDCNHVEVKGKEPEQVQITKEDEALIRSIAAAPDAYDKLVQSIAPVILGHLPEKEAILLLLAGSSATILPDGTKLRGDINALFVGDPGTGKSELLKFASQVAPRGLYASGRGTTAAGLSAAVIREKNVLMLEAGVVVLADLGIAAIDEFEKMKPEDRTALHEMMEQQTVTIAKGGIYATLNARTAILAACNPVLGRYNPFQNLTENIGTLPIPLLSVGPNEQVLVRVGGIVQSRKIGEFVDSFYSPGEEGYPMFVKSMGIDVASMDTNFKVGWQPLRYVFRHKNTQETYRVSFKGRSLELTGGHSVYTFEDGRLTLKPASQLRIGDHIAVAKRLPVEGEVPSTYNMLNYVSMEGAFLHHVPSEALPRLEGIKPYERRMNRIPARMFRALTDGELTQVCISRQGSGFYVPVFVRASADLFRLLGYFVAEGSMVYNRSEGVYAVDFSLDAKKDKHIISDIISISKRLFHVTPTVAPYNNGAKVDIRSRIVVEFLSGCFGLKSGAKEKRIPDIVFNAPEPLKQEFISAYYAGDAGVTTSAELASQLLQLFAQLGQLASIFKSPPHDSWIGGRVVKGSGYYLVPKPKTSPHSNNGQSFPPLSETLPLLKPLLGGLAPTKKSVRKALTPRYWFQLKNAIWVRNKISKLSEIRERPNSVTNLASRYGITEGSCSEFISGMVDQGIVQKFKTTTPSGYQLLCSLTEKGEEVLETIEYLDKVVTGDLAFVEVHKIERLSAQEAPSSVYDLSVPDCENFVAATAICHNSRFDLIFVFKDQPTPAEDEKLASHILAVHSKRSYTAPPPIEFSLLKKYLAFSKKVSPNLTKEAVDRLKAYYLELRRAGGGDESIPPTPRTLEALIRVATARARVLLREEVTEEDALAAIALMNRMVEDVLTDATTKKTDFGIQLGKPVGETRNLRAAMEIFKSLEGAEKKPVERKIFKEELVKAKFSDEDADKMIRTMFREGMVYESKPGFVRRLGG